MASLSITNSQSSLRLTSIQSVMPSSHLILYCPLLLLPPIPSSIRVFSNESALRTGGSALASVLPMNTKNWFPLGWTGWISLQSKGLSRVFSNTTVQKHQFISIQLSSQSKTHIHTWPLEKLWPWVDRFVSKVMSLLWNMLSSLVITFLPRSKRLLISWLQSPPTVILQPKKIRSDTVSTLSPSISHKVMGPDAMIFVFWMLSFKPTF